MGIDEDLVVVPESEHDMGAFESGFTLNTQIQSQTVDSGLVWSSPIQIPSFHLVSLHSVRQ